jgi:hypothetical protein
VSDADVEQREEGERMSRAKFQIPDRDPGRPKVPFVSAMVRKFYDQPGNEAGGLLHVVLDDGNLEDSHIDYARDRALDACDYRAWLIATCLLQMTPTQRRKVQRAICAAS